MEDRVENIEYSIAQFPKRKFSKVNEALKQIPLLQPGLIWLHILW